MNSDTPLHRNTKLGHTPWRFYHQLRQHGERIQTALKNGPGYGAEIKHRYKISTQIYKKIVRFLAKNPSSVVRAVKCNRWDAVEHIVFAASGPGFRRLPSYNYVIELLKVTCAHQFYDHEDVEPMVVESAMAEDATPPPVQTGAGSQPPQVEAELPLEPETASFRRSRPSSRRLIPRSKRNGRKPTQIFWRWSQSTFAWRKPAPPGPPCSCISPRPPSIPLRGYCSSGSSSGTHKTRPPSNISRV